MIVHFAEPLQHLLLFSANTPHCSQNLGPLLKLSGSNAVPSLQQVQLRLQRFLPLTLSSNPNRLWKGARNPQLIQLRLPHFHPLQLIACLAQLTVQICEFLLRIKDLLEKPPQAVFHGSNDDALPCRPRTARIKLVLLTPLLEQWKMWSLRGVSSTSSGEAEGGLAKFLLLAAPVSPELESLLPCVPLISCAARA